ncbi:hypothetical protein HAX54_010673, partial [Datura stramonium]|nr:hypothetical protein [Datura stramonium]
GVIPSPCHPLGDGSSFGKTTYTLLCTLEIPFFKALVKPSMMDGLFEYGLSFQSYFKDPFYWVSRICSWEGTEYPLDRR